MAVGNTVSIDANRPELWRKELWADVSEKIVFAQHGLMARGKPNENVNAVVKLMDDLNKDKGDTITFALTTKLGANSGVTGDNELEGNESQLTSYSESMAISQWRDAVRLSGRLDEQKNAYDMRKDAKDKLSIRIQEFLEKQVFIKLAGVTNSSLTDVTGATYCGTFTDGTNVHAWSNTPDAIPAADTAAGQGNRYLCADFAAGADSLASTDELSPGLIERAVIKAETIAPYIQPLRIKGQNYYVLFVHPHQMYDLREDTTFSAALKDAWWRGEENPLFKNADLVWNGVIIKKHNYVPFLDISVAGNNFAAAASGTDFSADAYRALLCGAQAVCISNAAKGPQWEEKSFDYGNKWAISSGIIGGVHKPMFNSKEYGVIAIDTASSITVA